jgi:hypothetical protein
MAGLDPAIHAFLSATIRRHESKRRLEGVQKAQNQNFPPATSTQTQIGKP